MSTAEHDLAHFDLETAMEDERHRTHHQRVMVATYVVLVVAGLVLAMVAGVAR